VVARIAALTELAFAYGLTGYDPRHGTPIKR
jgi:hypothetical protein